MMRRTKVCLAGIMLLTIIVTLCGCDDANKKDRQKTYEVSLNLAKGQPTPTDITYSLQRYNLIRRAYWINGMRDKARSFPCEVEKPLGYIYLLLEGVGIVAEHTVDGQITSLLTYLTPDTAYDVRGTTWLADVDGTYGENTDAIFFFTVDGNYIEWKGNYYYSDIYYDVGDVILKVQSKD